MTYTTHTKKRGVTFSPAELTIGDLDLRPDVALSASRPSPDNPMPRLLDAVVLTLLAEHGGDPTSALCVTAELLRSTTWSRYRNGRSRIATMAASYLRWNAPPSPWVFDGAVPLGESTRAGVGWRARAGRLVDLISCDRSEDRRIATCAHPRSSSEIGLRLLNLAAPRDSLFISSSGQPTPLGETSWFFAEETAS